MNGLAPPKECKQTIIVINHWRDDMHEARTIYNGQLMCREGISQCDAINALIHAIENDKKKGAA